MTGRWSPATAFEEARVARRVARSGCPLSARQLEILGVFASGEVASLKDVAARLGVGVSSVRNHMAATARALGTSSTTQAVVVALREGWVSLGSPAADEAA